MGLTLDLLLVTDELILVETDPDFTTKELDSTMEYLGLTEGELECDLMGVDSDPTTQLDLVFVGVDFKGIDSEEGDIFFIVGETDELYDFFLDDLDSP